MYDNKFPQAIIRQGHAALHQRSVQLRHITVSRIQTWHKGYGTHYIVQYLTLAMMSIVEWQNYICVGILSSLLIQVG